MSNENRTKHSMLRAFEVPVSAQAVASFLDSAGGDSAELKIIVQEGGDQRDPYPVKYLFSLHWYED